MAFLKDQDLLQAVGAVPITDMTLVNWHAVSDSLHETSTRLKQLPPSPDACMRRWVQLLSGDKTAKWEIEEVRGKILPSHELIIQLVKSSQTLVIINFMSD
jgi:hypothetical protein